MGKKISELEKVPSVSGTDMLPIGHGGSTAYGATMQQVKSFCNSGMVSDVRINGSTVLQNGVAQIPLASSSVNGAMSMADKTKLDNIQISGIKVVTSEVSASDNILYIVVS